MNDSTADQNRECFTDFAIQEYIMGRLDTNIRVEIETHFDACKECATCHNQYVLDRKFMTTLLQTPSEAPTGLCLTDEVLAQFLDNSLDETSRAQCEAHLSTCEECMQELLHMYDDMTRLMSPHQDHTSLSKPTPQGLILRMPKRDAESTKARKIDWPIDEAGSA